MKRVLVLFSGGVDSTALIYHARDVCGFEPAALHVQYDHPARADEYLSATRIAGELDLDLLVTSAAMIARELYLRPGARGARVVPGRNLILLALACNYAHIVPCDLVWIGCTREDALDYPDCRPPFIRGASDLMRRTSGIQCEAPLIDMDRARILERYGPVERFGSCWSCYQPTDAGEQCGECNSCRQGGSAL